MTTFRYAVSGLGGKGSGAIKEELKGSHVTKHAGKVMGGGWMGQ